MPVAMMINEVQNYPVDERVMLADRNNDGIDVESSNVLIEGCDAT